MSRLFSVPLVLLLVLSSVAVQASVFVRGDTNGDGQLDISDVARMLGCMFRGSDCPSCDDALDVNDNGRINITAGVFLLNYIFWDGLPPPGTGSGWAMSKSGESIPLSSWLLYLPPASLDPSVTCGPTLLPSGPSPDWTPPWDIRRSGPWD